ncbi:MAG: HNH endonuclease [Candidatus Woesearchaeota archaeon]
MDNLKKSVLVLNSSWIAIRIKTVKQAIKILCRKRACVINPNDYFVYKWEDWIKVEGVEGECIRASHYKIKIPEVIVLTLYDKLPSHDIKFSKKNVFKRDDYTCQYTGKKVNPKNADIDHIIPKSKGGKSTWSNCVVCSKDINRKKSNKLLKDTEYKLIKKPKKPNYMSLLIDKRKKIPKSWEKFL